VAEEPRPFPALEQVRQLLFPDLPAAEGRERVQNAIAGAADADRWQRIERIAADEPVMLRDLIEELRATRAAKLEFPVMLRGADGMVRSAGVERDEAPEVGQTIDVGEVHAIVESVTTDGYCRTLIIAREDPGVGSPQMTSRLNRVQVDVAGELVDLTWDERDALLRKLRRVAECETIVQKFEAVGASRAVQLDDEQQTRLRVTLELWGVSTMPDGLMRLLLALVRDDPGGDVSTGRFEG
jgi:hypothetical protein